MQLNKRELGAVLTGLRAVQLLFWSSKGAVDGDDLHYLLDVLSDGGTMAPINEAEIELLCERLNAAPDVPEWAFDIVMQLAEQNLAPEWDDDTAGQRVLQEEAVDVVRDYLHQNKIWR